MKKVISVVLSFVLLLSIFSIGSLNVSASLAGSGYYVYETYTGDFEYTLKNNEAIILGCDNSIASSAGNFIIPRTLDGYPVMGINYGAFSGCKNFTSVTIPDCVRIIDGCAFKGCTNLREVTIPNSVTDIGSYAFEDCSYLLSISIPKSVKNMGSGVFSGCSRLVNVTIETGVKSIGGYAFYYCENLKSINIPDSVTSIGNYAFYYCSSLTSITISDSVKSIGSYAFKYCSNLKNVYISDVAAWCDISFKKENLFNESDIIYSNPLWNYANLYLNGSIITNLVIPEGVTNIGDHAFNYCTGLTSITIPNSVTNIGEHAFYACPLQNISVSSENENFSSVDDVLFNKDKTELILYPRQKAETSYSIPNSVMYIGNYAFAYCSNLTDITIPYSVTNIGEQAFRGCYGLTNINIDSGNTTFSSIEGVLFNKNKTELIKYPEGKIITSYVIPDTVEKIHIEAFANSSIRYITIPISVDIIEKNAFAINSSNLTIYYRGSQSDKNSIHMNDSILTSKIWYYNSCIGSSYHTFDDNCDNDCSVCQYIREAPHYYNWIIDKQENCGITGIKHEECTKCHTKHNENTVIVATGMHDFDDSCDITCNVCGFIREIDHTYSNACDTECNVCKELREVGEHDYSFNCGFTCIHCKYSKKPDVPQAIEVNHNSIILKNYEGLEYSIDGINWQISNTFKNLTPNSEYSFYQRVKASNNALESENSDGISIFTKKTFNINFNANGGSNAPATQLKGEGVPINISSQKPTRKGYVFAGWGTTEKFGKQYAPGEEYTKDKDITFYALWYKSKDCINCNAQGEIKVSSCYLCSGYGKRDACTKCGSTNITEYITGYGSIGKKCNSCSTYPASTSKTVECYNCSGGGYIYKNCDVCNGSGIEIKKINAPTIISFTDSAVTILPKEGYEYSKNGDDWQESNVFTNLLPATNYTFYVRLASDGTTPFSTISLGATITTDKSKQLLIPDEPTVQSFTSSSITLTPVDGCEYSKNGTTWQTSNVFSGLSCATEYTFYQRYKETEATYAGKSSASLVTRTEKGMQSKPSAPTILSKTHNSVTLTTLSGYEYSRDGINWQTSNVFSELTPETNYMFYQRKAETAIFYASEASAALTVKTAEQPICIINPELHSYDNNCDTDCNVCGNIRTITHQSDSGTVTKKATCTSTGTKNYKCTLCKATIKTETIAKLTTHTYSNNCDKSCNVCGKTRTVGAHKYSNSCDTTCNYCNAKRTIKHTYSNSCDTSCNVCKATRIITHSYKTTTTKATISKNGSIVKKCTVCSKVASNTTIKYAKTFKLSTTTYTYNGKVKTPSVTVKDSAGKSLKKNTDYTVSYASGRKNVGTYKVTIKMKGKYSGTKTLTFKINPAKITVSKLTAGKKRITVAITKKSIQVTGYQIQYSTSKKFTNAKTKTISSYKTTKHTLKSLSAKKTYYVRVRTYKTVGKTKYYSGWSTYKKVKTK
ncbi:MAG: leucine-rich repeat protein [Clostridia bacterium]|nr:leucine-rich repeat protein [Clostridia bacterium]